MRKDAGCTEDSSTVAVGGVAMATTPVPEPSVRMPLRWRVPRFARGRRLVVSPLAGRLALGALIIATLAVVAIASSDPSVLVPRSASVFPNWEAGPLHFLTPRPTSDPHLFDIFYSVVLVAMVLAYGLVLGSARSFGMRTITIAIIVLHVILLLSPPLQLTDVFNYLGYARLGALHHLDPYTHTIREELFDPVFTFASWHNLKSPYGELFTAISYPLGLLPLPVAYWLLKLVTVALSLGFLALLYRLARQLDRDPRFVLAFVALNPVYLLYELGGFHNDFFMLVPAMAAISLVLCRRDRWAGASLTLAIAVKFTAVLLAPFLLVAIATRARARQLIIGALIAAVPLLVMSVALFGSSLPNLQQQSTLLTDFSFPNLVGLIFGVGGTPRLLQVADVCVVLVVAYHLFYRRGDWLVGAGWSTFALIVSLSWAVPWYVVWLLPLAALSTSRRLQRWTVALLVFLLLAFLPYTSLYMSEHGINPLHTKAGVASQRLQNKLAS